MHDLDHHGRSMVHNPLAIFGLWCLSVWQGVRDFFQGLHRLLFPRRDRIYGSKRDSRVIGSLTFGQKTHDLDVPIHHMHVELWARTWWLGWRKLGQAVTDREGRYSIGFDLHYARRPGIRRVWVEFYTTGNHRFEEGRPVNDYVLFKRVKILKRDLVGMDYNVGKVQLFYWEYNYDSPVPRVIIKDHDRDAPQAYAQGRVDAMEKQFVPIELTKLKHLEEIAHARGKLTIPKIQADYPENLTVCMEKRFPGLTRGDDWFGDRMMNGMYATEFDRDPEDPELLWAHYHWNTYEKTEDFAMPDVDIWYRLKDDGLPVPVKIALTGPLNAHELGERPRRVFTPEDGDRWLQVKRIARVSGALATELIHHFAGTHLNTEQFAIAAYRNLRLSPLTTLLFPHIKEVVLVDHTADQILINTGYITTATALTPKGINQVVFNAMGTLDWKGFRPMEPLSDAHAFARVANAYWDLILGYVSEFIDRNAEEIRRHWFEVYRFSQDLVNHSVPVFLCKYLQKALFDEWGKLKPEDAIRWYHRDQRMELPLDRPVVKGIPRAMSRITSAEDFHDADPKDWDYLKQACAYVIYQSTFGHTWANSKQYDDIGEILYNSLGLRFGDGPDGVLAPESDYRIAPDLTRATQEMWWSNMLSRTGYGFITANEDGDINPRLIELLEARRDELVRLGLNVDEIQSRTNI
jgi:hypothetical protein